MVDLSTTTITESTIKAELIRLHTELASLKRERDEAIAAAAVMRVAARPFETLAQKLDADPERYGDSNGLDDWEITTFGTVRRLDAALATPSKGAEALLAVVEAAPRARMAAGILLQNAVGCAENHYGADCQTQGEPGWLRDVRIDIEKLDAALRAYDGSKGDGNG